MPATARADVNFKLDHESVEDHGSYLLVRGRASTFSRDRVGDTVTRAALERAVETYMATNPILLFEHKYSRPAGTVTKAEVRDDGLHIEARLPRPADPLNLTWWGMVRDKVLRALSIGGRWTRDAMNRLVDVDRREISIAPVAVNGEAFIGAPLATQVGKAFGDDVVAGANRNAAFDVELAALRADVALLGASIAAYRLSRALST